MPYEVFKPSLARIYFFFSRRFSPHLNAPHLAARHPTGRARLRLSTPDQIFTVSDAFRRSFQL